MNKNKLKSYAPVARREFIQVVTERAKVLGLSHDKIEPVEVKGDVAIIAGRPFPLDVADRRKIIEAQIRLKGFELVMEEVAYTWFNRFVALRFMELHDYLGHGFRVLSNPSGSDIPEILEKATSVDLTGLDKARVAELRLAGDKDAELYKLLLVTQCNALYRAIPFLFEWVSDASELLLPENLLQTNSPLRKLVNEIPEEDWQEIEIVGWLYQFYISEKKDQVIGKVVKSEDIPAATQLFTPNWIVKYMVQNTLGRKWLMTYPDSSIRGQMEFYIKPAEQEPAVQAQLEAITPKELNPEELTFMDPACGSGHILVEAYDLFKQIYLDRGYRTKDVPRLILEKNLFGLDIDDRAAQLARFAVLMKARADDRRILDSENPVRLNILSLQESKGMDMDKIAEVLLRERVKEISTGKPQQQYLIQPKVSQASLSFVEKSEVSKDELFSLLNLFKDAKTFGSLLTIHEKLKGALPKLEKLLAKAKTLDVQSQDIAMKLLPLVEQANLLVKKYDYVVTNPPYMGGKGLNPLLKSFLKDNYEDVKSDLFSAFIVRCFEISRPNAQLGFMSPFVWMFISSYEKLREFLINKKAITTLIQLEYSGFDGATVPICTYTLENSHFPRLKGSYIRLSDFRGSENQAPKTLEAIQNPECDWLFRASASDFKKIPGSPIAYWISVSVRNLFQSEKRIAKISPAKIGMRTGDNNKYLRFWHEVDFDDFMIGCTGPKEALDCGKRWFPYCKGGSFRKWYGNNEYVVNWKDNGFDIKENTLRNYPQLSWDNLGWKISNEQFYFIKGITWTATSSSHFGVRCFEPGFLFDVKGSSCFPPPDKYEIILGLLASKMTRYILKFLNPTIEFQPRDISNIPIPEALIRSDDCRLQEIVKQLITISKDDWDSFEFSWDFSSSPLAPSPQNRFSIVDLYDGLRIKRLEQIQRYKFLERDCNQIIISSAQIEDVLDSSVPEDEITLNCNTCHRYGLGRTEEEYETAIRVDTIKELISYVIGCMMGRYSLDEPGLVYAHSGNQNFDLDRYTTFPADEDGIVPVMDDDWFEDDATNRFVEFIQVAWSPETLDENLKFVADSLEPKRGESPIETIRRFISTKFFKDHHLKVYKKRPIYWLFSSGKHKAFECLVYLHRYNETTLARMRSAYVTPLQGKISARIEYLKKEVDAASSTSTRKQFQKELDTMTRKQQELREFDEKLRHYADLRISLNLDDGVKVNYGKFGDILAEVKTITGGESE